MKKLILGIVMFYVGISKFAEIYSTSTVLRSGQAMMHFDDFDFIVCTAFAAIMFFIGIAGLAIAFIGAKEKKNTDAKTE